MSPRAPSRTVRLALFLALLPGCVFCPDLESAGYLPCAADDDCVAGRYCDEGMCAPPPWNDEAYGVRQHLVVKNESDTEIPAGAPIPVRVGEGGTLPREAVGVDGRFMQFDRKKGAWRMAPIFRDLEGDRYTAWVPLQRAIAPGASDTLAWVESQSEEKEPTQVEDPEGIFAAYASFSDGTLDGWFESSPGSDPPLVQNGVANVADNQALVLQTPLQPPVQLTFIARVNGNICDEVFLGLVGGRESIFNDAPSAGLFVRNDLVSSFDVAPTPASFPQPVGEPLRAPTRFARVTVHVDAGRASLRVDEGGADVQQTADDDLRPPFGDASMYPAIQVGGACSVDVDALWATPLPLPAPTVTAEAPVQLKLLF